MNVPPQAADPVPEVGVVMLRRRMQEDGDVRQRFVEVHDEPLPGSPQDLF